MAVGIASTTGPEIPAFEPQQPDNTETDDDLFDFAADGSVNLDLNGRLNVAKKATFEGNVEIDGNLVVQGVNILDELNAINSSLSSINSSIASILSSLSS